MHRGLQIYEIARKKNQLRNIHGRHQTVCKKNEKELETQTKNGRDVEMEFSIEKCAIISLIS